MNMASIRLSVIVLFLLLVACQQSADSTIPLDGEAVQGTQTPALHTVSPSTTPEEPPPAAMDTANAGSDPNSDATATEPPTPAPLTTQPATESNTEPSDPPTDGTPAPEVAETVTLPDVEGALIQVSMTGEVGVLLDEFPEEMRDRLAAELIAAADDFWRDRAERQVRLTTLRLHFRDFDAPDKGQLPLPPAELWEITLDAAGPRRVDVQGHDLVMLPYAFDSILLTDVASVGDSEPNLGQVGGQWQEPFILPADPDFLLQRTSNACINEGGFPANSFDSENAWRFFDDTCTADSGGVTGCHRTRLPRFDCREAIELAIGQVETAVQFERLPWDEELAAAVTVGPVTTLDAPDLLAVEQDLGDNRLIMRYVPPGDCGFLEGAVGGLGWRRLLTFGATVHNVGGEPLHIGQVRGGEPHNLFQYNACHNHYHYRNYGDFFLGDLTNLTMDTLAAGSGDLITSKQAFCVQSTSRFSNSVLAPLTHEYSCNFQGVQTGWVDEYIAGLDTQWVDVTDLEIPDEGLTVQLGFRSNADQFLCEGQPVLDDNGEPIWEATGFRTETGASVDRPLCTLSPDWDANNIAVHELFIPQAGSFVTMPCAQDELGPKRNCGFVEQELEDSSCVPEQPVELMAQVTEVGAPQVVRICEYSAAWASGVACTFNDALANVIVSAVATPISFSCPVVRDAEELEGQYSVYTAPAWPIDDAQPVNVVR